MTNEDYVTYETAQALKRAGFDWKCRAYYWTADGRFKETDYKVHANSATCATMVAAPALHEAQKWLREVKQVYVWVYPEYKQGDKPESVRWYFTSQPLYYIRAQIISKVHGANFPTYESALSAGIDAALKYVTNKANEL